ncbi:UDP-N-acetylmuramoyl-L-alanyl-D-glutamate--2,6-diaminopimelate ligase [Candidatus Neptunochlamydia vexilliferae]|uniref:UDP-N-acetylmuramoyl-L-alanyl-D-glutamate--2,6-diaminopimelate ligase n=1 Tax=Candidatus Neptunichlamydia vexilliferae TaxID=1651774 RepID=A0ABS0B0S4_9BACT|nr:UDP-N-acetylmuramoyl-L-alanyl-D-glutamate--2,6-diaminopimelate ligase [Candidatus Neptunochlamydia vexilliferae]MBF5059799.1 UDP-N-acetylmuramoyl-L-alanyl-D-glutamate--2,6- diaminopimelate ligase [Candidatus Neptunochlamydia vexilliferae]
MKLKKLLKDLDVEVKGSREVEVTGISAHSQFVVPGNLFIARKGKSYDGTEFIPKAVETGAVAILTDFYNPFLQGVVQIITPKIALLEALLAKRYYETEKTPLFLVGITGTNGKTTTAYLVHHLLAHCGLMGTIETVMGKQRFPSKLTTADVVTNHKLLREMGDQGLKAVVMEVTSHALDQNRVEGMHFDIGVFTNLSQDHLDYHGTMEAYLKAKLKLFKQCKETIYNKDDAAADKFSEGMTFAIEQEANLVAKNIHFSLEGTTFDLHYKGKITPFQSQLMGRYNVYNCLAALAVALKKGERMGVLQKKLATFGGVPGRLERIANAKGIYLFVDFAHTPEALSKVLETLHSIKKGRIITIFGCGGERDQDKRPKMARAAEEYSDQVIITSDNPRSEDPLTICQEVAKGLIQEPLIEVDRRAAIERGIFMAKEGDILLIAGRGHEPFQKIEGRQIPFDDREVAREFINR